MWLCFCFVYELCEFVLGLLFDCIEQLVFFIGVRYGFVVGVLVKFPCDFVRGIFGYVEFLVGCRRCW